MEPPSNPVVEALQAYAGRTFDAGPAFTVWLGGILRMVGVGELEMEFVTRPEWANPVGTLHGGMQAAILDEMIGFATFTLGEAEPMVTIDLHVNFLGKAAVGTRVKARARVVRHGRRISHAVCELYDDTGRPIARADANLVRMDSKG
jgi:uncharacterized protein (TIGR00369 family)